MPILFQQHIDQQSPPIVNEGNCKYPPLYIKLETRLRHCVPVAYVDEVTVALPPMSCVHNTAELVSNEPSLIIIVCPVVDESNQ